MSPPHRRIVHLASGREWRGGQNQVRLLATALAGSGAEAPEQVVVTGRHSVLAARVAAAGVPVRAVGWQIGLSPSALAGALAEIRRGPSILHAHDAHALTLAGIASSLTGTPFVVTRRVDIHLRRRGYWARANRIIAISKAVRDILLADGISGNRVTVVHSGIDLEGVRATSVGAIRSELGIPEGAPLAVTAGALVDHKDHATLIDAGALLRNRRPDLVWVIAGEGPLRGALEAQIRERGLDDRVRLPGHVNEVLRLIRAADVFVMSSKEEGLGTTVLDAMALDVPIAATAGGGIPEMLHGGAGLLSPPGNAAALADSVNRLLEDPSLRENTRRIARERVEQFSATAMAKGVLSVYRSIDGDR